MAKAPETDLSKGTEVPLERHLEALAARIAAGYAGTAMPAEEIAEKSLHVAMAILRRTRVVLRTVAKAQAAGGDEPEGADAELAGART